LGTKINATVDALGNPTGFTLTPGQACDLDGADILLPQVEADIVIADKGFDADQRVIEPLEKVGKRTVIPPKANGKYQREYDKEL
jgi:transposase